MPAIFIKIKRPKTQKNTSLFEELCKAVFNTLGVKTVKYLQVRNKNSGYLVNENEVELGNVGQVISPHSGGAVEYACDAFVPFILGEGKMPMRDNFMVSLRCKDSLIRQNYRGLLFDCEIEIEPWNYFLGKAFGPLRSTAEFSNSNEVLLGIINNIVKHMDPASIMLFSECEHVLGPVNTN
ncbi:hypothetical protein TERTU_3656 [Teredinibacter turnerae T7901]|uniref:Uncharacterized protein n=1 Tax=Teredinibacter turnerae (strain ATCC 39867 / T7901) TaxID=377629 RepID=C5BS44_TERTT|nr:hypothetical protein [Teredinibacter turnerae]ACR12536.1 hypothetical protein TERTU_3656 [Teredinibacter turnerae T7901]